MNEVNEKELEQVSGGMTCEYTSLNAGDVFMANENSSRGLVITRDYPVLTDNTNICYRAFSKIGVEFRVRPEILHIKRGALQSDYTYSKTYSGVIPYN